MHDKDGSAALAPVPDGSEALETKARSDAEWQAFHEDCYDAGKAVRKLGGEAGEVAAVAGRHLADAGSAAGSAGAEVGRALLDQGKKAGSLVAEKLEGKGDAALGAGRQAGQALAEKGGEVARSSTLSCRPAAGLDILGAP